MCQNPNQNRNLTCKGWVGYLLGATLWLVFCTVLCNGSALAHKVTIFAWVEGDTIHTQSKFSGGRVAKKSTVVVYDKEGNQLLEGKTDENGEFSFKVPKKTELTVALKASMGHLAEWTIPVEEITEVTDSSERTTARVGDKPAIQESVHSTVAETNSEVPAQTAVGLSRQEVKALIDESLDKKLTPITNMLADSLDPGPRVGEVIGGIGYIFGLVGVALYFATRRKRK